MTPLTGVVRNGKIEIVTPVNLAEGTEVKLFFFDNCATDDDETMTDAEIARTLAAMDKFAAEFPVDEGGEDLSLAAKESADWEKSNFDSRVASMRRLFD